MSGQVSNKIQMLTEMDIDGVGEMANGPKPAENVTHRRQKNRHNEN